MPVICRVEVSGTGESAGVLTSSTSYWAIPLRSVTGFQRNVTVMEPPAEHGISAPPAGSTSVGTGGAVTSGTEKTRASDHVPTFPTLSIARTHQRYTSPQGTKTFTYDVVDAGRG